VRSLLLALCVLVAAPALAQTPPPQTIDFEDPALGTPIPYEPGVKVPKSARIKKIALASGGTVKFRTRGGSKYAALVTHLGTTAVVGVGGKGKIQPGRYLDIRIRKAKTARFDSFNAIPAGARNDDKGTTDPADDEIVAYDNPGSAGFLLYDSRGNAYPIGGSSFVIVRAAPGPYDVTTTSLDFVRIQIAGTLVYDDLVVSFGH
jgi:hypothetical protein